MKTYRNLKCQFLTFFFNINGLEPEDNQDWDAKKAINNAAANCINVRAHELLSKSLPQASCWYMAKPDLFDEDEYTPFTLDEPMEDVLIHGQCLHELSICSHGALINQDVIANFKELVVEAYEQAAREFAGTVQLCRVETAVLEETMTTCTVEVA